MLHKLAQAKKKELYDLKETIEKSIDESFAKNVPFDIENLVIAHVVLPDTELSEKELFCDIVYTPEEPLAAP
jgi:hypothetical protein